MKNKINNFLKSNAYIFCYILISIFIEYLAVFVTSGKLWISLPGIFITIIVSCTLVLIAIRKQKLRFITSCVFLLVHGIICLFFITSFILTSGTIFDFAQLNLASDGMGTIEALKPDFSFCFPAAAVISLYFIVGQHFIKDLPTPHPESFIRTTVVCLLCITFTAQGLCAYRKNYNASADMTGILYNAESSDYSNQGIIGNFINQLYKGIFFSNVELGDADELHDYIYQSVSHPTNTVKGGVNVSGLAKDMNVITILAESFEWFSFISNLERFPNGLDVNEHTLRELFPNLYEVYDTSFVFDNHHSREKTDISENYSLLGCYPTGVYVNYDFPDNSMPFSVPNVMKNLFDVTSKNYHNGLRDFYNRTYYLTEAVGFESFTATDTMLKISKETGKNSFIDYTVLGERNLDSQMIETCKEEMFPTDRRFSVNITTITQHGQYTPRNNLKSYYEKLDNLGLLPYFEDINDEENNMKNNYRTYVAAAMELDKAIGIINDYLKDNGLFDNTMLVIFGDHNAYYDSLSAYIKGLEKVTDELNYSRLFNVPFMIRVGNITQNLSKEDRTINKFTCSADIVPTVYDLLGVSYFTNMCYGTSAFNNQKTTVLYSRAYEVFITDKMYFYNLNNIIYQHPDVDDDYVEQITKDATELLTKISHINRIFYNDYFKGNNGKNYVNKFIEIQQGL